MAKKYNHLHRYQKKKLGKNGYTVFKCMVAGCSHYIRKELAEGQIAECNRCHEPFILNKASIQLSKPHCDKCIIRKDKDVHDLIKDFLVSSEAAPEETKP